MKMVEGNTVFEAKEEHVSCGLWPTPSRQLSDTPPKIVDPTEADNEIFAVREID